MLNFLKNNKGASLIEIVASITITSIALILIYNIFSFNIRQNKINREQTINANIANGVLNYFSSQDFSIFRNHLGEYKYVKIDVNTCKLLYTNENEVNNCEVILSPLINNKQYNNEDLYVYLLPYYGPEGFNDIANISSDELLEYIINDDFQYDYVNHNTLTVIIIVESSLNNRYHYILRGVITKW